MTRGKVRYYLHNLDGLKQEIADINADLEQYRAMSSDSLLVDADPDPYPSGHDLNEYSGGVHNQSSHAERVAVKRADFIARLEQELFDKKTMLSAINCVLYYLNSYDRQVDKQIIQLRYTEHLPWAVIARKLNYDRDTLWHRDCRIIDEIISNYNARLK